MQLLKSENGKTRIKECPAEQDHLKFFFHAYSCITKCTLFRSQEYKRAKRELKITAEMLFKKRKNCANYIRYITIHKF